MRMCTAALCTVTDPAALLQIRDTGQHAAVQRNVSLMPATGRKVAGATPSERGAEELAPGTVARRRS